MPVGYVRADNRPLSKQIPFTFEVKITSYYNVDAMANLSEGELNRD